MDISEKLRILTAAAKYDVACTSSGVDRAPQEGGIGSAVACGICHSFAGDGRCITMLKILMSNACAYNCAYCVNRAGNDTPRATLTPREIADITINFYRRNYIEGLFLSSGVLGNPTRTTELMAEALRILREEYRFFGYIHAKVIPGTDREAIDRLGALCDRMSINIELPSNESLRLLAPDKTKEAIFGPMGYLSGKIEESRALGYHRNHPGFAAALSGGQTTALTGEGTAALAGGRTTALTGGELSVFTGEEAAEGGLITSAPSLPQTGKRPVPFAPAGQSTQMIIGASPESDLSILRLSEALYKKYKLKRVFFSAYIPVVENTNLPALDTKPPLLRENRLYQADWLIRVYGFKSSEILDDEHPSFNPYLDPKCNWAVNHPEFFPVEINRAPYEALLRVPGVGVLGARKIMRARRVAALTYGDLKKLGVVLKRAQYFITCSGRTADDVKITQSAVLNSLLSKSAIERLKDAETLAQLSMFENAVSESEILKSVTGQM